MPGGHERFKQTLSTKRPAATHLLSVNCLYQMNPKNCKRQFENCMSLLIWCLETREIRPNLTRHVVVIHGLRRGLHSFAPSELGFEILLMTTLSRGLRDDFCSRFGFERGICDIGHRFRIHFFHTIEAGAGGLVARTSSPRTPSSATMQPRSGGRMQPTAQAVGRAKERSPSPGGAKETCPTHPATFCFT